MSAYLIVAFVGAVVVCIVGLWLAKKVVKIAIAAVLLGVLAAAIYWFSQEDIATTSDVTGYLTQYAKSSLVDLF